MSPRHFPFALPLCAAIAGVAAPAAADLTKAECVKANTEAQSLRRDGKLAEARAQLRRCGDPTCPGIVRADCSQRLDELEAAQPTIVFDAKDGSGHDLSAVRVTVDGLPLAESLDGKALQIDPGSHEFTFTVAGQPPVTQTYVLREGQKERHEPLVLGAPPAQLATPPQPPPLSPAPAPAPVRSESGGLGTQRVAALAAGGVGVAGIAAGAVFGMLASSKWSQAERDCGPACPADAPARGEESDARTRATVSTVGFVVGGAGLAAGVVLWLTSRPAAGPPAPTGRLSVTPSVGAGTTALFIHGGF